MPWDTQWKDRRWGVKAFFFSRVVSETEDESEDDEHICARRRE